VEDDGYDERNFVAASQTGDSEAFGALVARHQQIAFRAAYLILRDASDSEDVTQDAFVRAYRGIAAFRQGEPFRPWLLRIVTNLAINEARARGRRRILTERFGQLPWRSPPQPDYEVLGAERRAAVLDAINTLKRDDSVVLYLRHFLELSEREIATVIGRPEGTVKSRLSRASMRLGKVIESKFPELREPVSQVVIDG